VSYDESLCAVTLVVYYHNFYLKGVYMKEIGLSKPIGKNYHLELHAFYRYPIIQTFPFGLRIAVGRNLVCFRFAFIVEIDFSIGFGGDHVGFDIAIDTPFCQVLDFEFYNINHER